MALNISFIYALVIFLSKSGGGRWWKWAVVIEVIEVGRWKVEVAAVVIEVGRWKWKWRQW